MFKAIRTFWTIYRMEKIVDNPLRLIRHMNRLDKELLKRLLVADTLLILAVKLTKNVEIRKEFASALAGYLMGFKKPATMPMYAIEDSIMASDNKGAVKIILFEYVYGWLMKHDMARYKEIADLPLLLDTNKPTGDLAGLAEELIYLDPIKSFLAQFD